MMLRIGNQYYKAFFAWPLDIVNEIQELWILIYNLQGMIICHSIRKVLPLEVSF